MTEVRIPRPHSATDLGSRRRARVDAARLADALLTLQREPPGRVDEFRPPRPWKTTLAAAAPLLAPLLLGGLGALSPLGAGLVALPLLVVASVGTGFAWTDLWKARALADRLLRSRPTAPLPPLAAWRAEELSSQRTRRQLQHWTRSLRCESARCLDPGPPLFRLSPIPDLDEDAVRASIALLHQLEDRLGEIGEPVSASGVLAVSALVGGDHWSPLYFPERAADLPDALENALAALTVR